MPLPEGVLPNPVIRDPRSSGVFIFGQLDPGLAAPAVQNWLQEIDGYLKTLRVPDRHGLQHFDAAVGFGPSFFRAGGATRFVARVACQISAAASRRIAVVGGKSCCFVAASSAGIRGAAAAMAELVTR